ncbi:MAG: ArsR/SmtB family transcription factor [Acidimicrobiia bacterium]
MTSTGSTAETCCPPLYAGTLEREDAEALAAIMKALADPTRIQLLSDIAARGEVCACDLTNPQGLSQPTLSHHLKVLVAAGLLTREQRGRWAFFSVVRDEFRRLAAAIDPV